MGKIGAQLGNFRRIELDNFTQYLVRAQITFLMNCRLIGALHVAFNMEVPGRVANMHSWTIPETKYFHRDFSHKFMYEAASREYVALGKIQDINPCRF